MFAATTSASVLDMETDVCFFEKAVSGKYVLGPIMTKKQPVVLLLSSIVGISEAPLTAFFNWVPHECFKLMVQG